MLGPYFWQKFLSKIFNPQIRILTQSQIIFSKKTQNVKITWIKKCWPQMKKKSFLEEPNYPTYFLQLIINLCQFFFFLFELPTKMFLSKTLFFTTKNFPPFLQKNCLGSSKMFFSSVVNIYCFKKFWNFISTENIWF